MTVHGLACKHSVASTARILLIAALPVLIVSFVGGVIFGFLRAAGTLPEGLPPGHGLAIFGAFCVWTAALAFLLIRSVFARTYVLADVGCGAPGRVMQLPLGVSASFWAYVLPIVGCGIVSIFTFGAAFAAFVPWCIVRIARASRTKEHDLTSPGADWPNLKTLRLESKVAWAGVAKRGAVLVAWLLVTGATLFWSFWEIGMMPVPDPEDPVGLAAYDAVLEQNVQWLLALWSVNWIVISGSAWVLAAHAVRQIRVVGEDGASVGLAVEAPVGGTIRYVVLWLVGIAATFGIGGWFFYTSVLKRALNRTSAVKMAPFQGR